jgi:signal transduction histidine kinase
MSKADDPSNESLVDLVESSGDEAPERTRMMACLERTLEAQRDRLQRIDDRFECGDDRETIRAMLDEAREHQETTLADLRRAMRILDPEETSDGEPGGEASLGDVFLSVVESFCDEVARDVDRSLEGDPSLSEPHRSAFRHVVWDALASLADRAGADADVSVKLIGDDEGTTLIVSNTPEAPGPELLEAPDGDWMALRDRVREIGGEMTIETSWREGTSIVVDLPG